MASKAPKRIYTVTNTDTGEEALVNAIGRIQARNAIARATYTAELASQQDIVRLVKAGHAVIEADDAPEEQAKLAIGDL